jgi:hypothetical protein
MSREQRTRRRARAAFQQARGGWEFVAVAKDYAIFKRKASV